MTKKQWISWYNWEISNIKRHEKIQIKFLKKQEKMTFDETIERQFFRRLMQNTIKNCKNIKRWFVQMHKKQWK